MQLILTCKNKITLSRHALILSAQERDSIKILLKNKRNVCQSYKNLFNYTYTAKRRKKEKIREVGILSSFIKYDLTYI